MPNWFNRKLTLPNVKHSVHDLSHNFKTSLSIGQLIPTNVVDMLPSDKILHYKQDTLVRLAPMFYALMHRIKIHTSNFFTPYRIILGDNLYEDWLNNKLDLVPIKVLFTFSTPEEGEPAPANPFPNTIFDYLGLPPNMAVYDPDYAVDYVSWSITITNPIPYLSYLCIVRDWYLDSNLESETIESLENFIEVYRSSMESGISLNVDLSEYDSVLYQTFKVAYSKDYFNTARPQPELGSEMYVLNRPLAFTPPSDAKEHILSVRSNGSATVYVDETPQTINETTTIKDLWRKEMLQQYYQVDNTFGSRIREKIAGHFGVEISDKRIMIPRYCGGSSSTVKIQEVIQTSSTTEESALGFSAGRGIDFSRTKNQSFFCEEHGIYMSLISLIPENGYCNGVDRFWFKKNIFDFASPEFNNIGWQEVLNGEIFADGTSSDKGTFGYQPRYSEYRTMVSRVAGAFRTDPYLRWHLDRNFSELPPLNSEFLRVADTDRIFNYDGSETVNTENCFVDVYNDMKVSRPISYEPDSIHIY